MARIRTVKPSFFTSLTIAELSVEARLTFIGLWTHCDDEGRCLDDPRLLKAALWPLDDDVSATMVDLHVDQIAHHGLITRYSTGGRDYIQVNGWGEHQRINRPVASGIPAPIEDSLSAHGGLTEGSLPEGKGREGNREGKGVTRAHAIPSDFTPTDEQRTWAATIIRASAVDAETQKFIDHFTANGKTMKDWPAAWRNWIRRAREFDRSRPTDFRPAVVGTKCSEHPRMTQPCATCAAERAAGLRKDPA